MSQTIRDQILDHLAAAFAVDRDKPTHGVSELCKVEVVTAMTEGDDEFATDVAYLTYSATLEVGIERTAEAVELSSAQGNALLGELITLIPEPADFLPLVVEDCRPANGGTVLRGAGSSLVGARIAIAVVYRFDRRDPCNLTDI